MSRSDTNRSAEMEVFVRVVESGGFSAAARSFRMTPSAVSKLIGRLEARLGARLVNRSTRKLQLTAEGQAFYRRSVDILGDIAEAEHEAASGAAPRGRVRVNCNVPFGLHYLLPLVPRFVAAHPEVRHLCLFAHPINRVDATGVEVFGQLRKMLAERGITLHVSGLKLPVERVLERAGALSPDPLLKTWRTDAEALQMLRSLG